MITSNIRIKAAQYIEAGACSDLGKSRAMQGMQAMQGRAGVEPALYSQKILCFQTCPIESYKMSKN